MMKNTLATWDLEQEVALLRQHELESSPMKTRDTHRAVPQHDSMKSHHIEEHRHDPYKASQKIPEPYVRTQCMAVFLGGRWQWTTEPLERAQWGLCPACHRSNDKYPAGELILSGRFLKAHGQEIVRLARNTEALESREHPMQRIMAVENSDEKIVITTTDIHLARRIGNAIAGAYKGKFETHYDDGAYFLRVTWRRDD